MRFRYIRGALDDHDFSRGSLKPIRCGRMYISEGGNSYGGRSYGVGIMVNIENPAHTSGRDHDALRKRIVACLDRHREEIVFEDPTLPSDD